MFPFSPGSGPRGCGAPRLPRQSAARKFPAREPRPSSAAAANLDPPRQKGSARSLRSQTPRNSISHVLHNLGFLAPPGRQSSCYSPNREKGIRDANVHRSPARLTALDFPRLHARIPERETKPIRTRKRSACHRAVTSTSPAYTKVSPWSRNTGDLVARAFCKPRTSPLRNRANPDPKTKHRTRSAPPLRPRPRPAHRGTEPIRTRKRSTEPAPPRPAASPSRNPLRNRANPDPKTKPRTRSALPLRPRPRGTHCGTEPIHPSRSPLRSEANPQPGRGSRDADYIRSGD
jgi:hypothetical protein